MMGDDHCVSPPLAFPKNRRRRTSQKVEVLPLVVLFGALVLVGATTCVLVFSLPSSSSSSSSSPQDGKHEASLTLAAPFSSTTYTCPADTEAQPAAVNFDPIRFQNHYLQEEAHTKEFGDFLAHFRDTMYDDWHQTYTHMKAGMTAWKQRAIVPYIKSGDKIYESAMGMGLNAFMTLEILLEEKGPLAGLEIHGNEYLSSSTQRANAFLDHVLPPNVKKGNVCVGDSTNIAHVPSNSFDLVFTGYVL